MCEETLAMATLYKVLQGGEFGCESPFVRTGSGRAGGGSEDVRVELRRRRSFFFCSLQCIHETRMT